MGQQPRWRQSPDGGWQYLGDDGYWYPYDQGPPPATPPPRPTTAVRLSINPGTSWIVIVSGGLMALGSFFPWITASGLVNVSRNAFQLGHNETLSWNGPLLIIGAVIAIAIGVTQLFRTQMPAPFANSPLWAGIAGLIATIDGGTGANNLVHQANGQSSAVIASVGYGVWVAGVGAVGAILGGLLTWREQRALDALDVQPVPGVSPSPPGGWNQATGSSPAIMPACDVCGEPLSTCECRTIVEVDDPSNVQWRQRDDGEWEFLGSDGAWYLGDGPERVND